MAYGAIKSQNILSPEFSLLLHYKLKQQQQQQQQQQQLLLLLLFVIFFFFNMSCAVYNE